MPEDFDAANRQTSDDWPIPESLYVHVPFCRHRCGYCNFSVVAGRDDLVDRFLNAVRIELLGLSQPSIRTLFVGGGTPTHLSTKQLATFLGLMREHCRICQDCEWTAEANPEDITLEKMQVLADHGVNRISLGVQSFNATKLKILERGHSQKIAIDAIELAASKIQNVSIDLIFAAPNETLADWQSDLQTALSLPISHLSAYALTFEKGTAFWSRRRSGDLSPATESLEVDMYQASRSACRDNGFEHYEISNFAKPSQRCKHNLAYWRGRGWHAIGPGAARFVNGRREVNHRSTTTYLRKMEADGAATAESESISPVQYARERAAFGIRLLDGVDFAQLSLETNVDLKSECADAMTECQANGFLEFKDNHARLTERGIMFADSVASAFLG